jgi:CRISPR system Cascade subunit CasA
MNLTTDPWIPVIWRDGRASNVSLCDTFLRGEEIADLAVRPPERIALMRLLLCITHAALDADGARPIDSVDWLNCCHEVIEKSLQYLKEWSEAFNLFGKERRFLQAKGRGQPGVMSVNKLDFIDEDSTTLFDNNVLPRNQRSPQWLALKLLAYQSFAAGGKVGGSEKSGDRMVPQTGTNAPCRDQNAYHTFSRRPNLLKTVHANLARSDQIAGMRPLNWGRPVWELIDGGLPEAGKSREISRSYLGRLAPLSRAIWLNDDRETAMNSNGIPYPNFDSGFREPSTAYRTSEQKQKRFLVSAGRAGRIIAPWRELHAILIKQTTESQRGPICVYHLSEEMEFDVWVGALVANQAKVIDTAEFVFHVPAKMLKDSGRQIYEAGVRFAHTLSFRLGRAVRNFRHAMERAAFDASKQQKAEAQVRRMPSERNRLEGIEQDANLHYWTVAEGLVPELFKLVNEPPPIVNNKYRFQETAWGKRLFLAALEAYDLACPHETARQLKAYVLGRGVLAGMPATTDANPDLESQGEEKEEVLQ